MAAKNLIWPWSRFAELEAERDGYRAALDLSRSLGNRNAEAVREAKRIILEAHFRIPETGRLGKKGVIPKSLKAAVRESRS